VKEQTTVINPISMNLLMLRAKSEVEWWDSF
jgi:hypothetical protein